MGDGITAGIYLYADLPEVSFAAKVKNRQLNGGKEDPLIFYDKEEYGDHAFPLDKISEYITSNEPPDNYDYHHILLVFDKHISNLLVYPRIDSNGEPIIKDGKIQYDFKIDDSSLKHITDQKSERRLTSILRKIPGLEDTLSIKPENTIHGDFQVQGRRGYNCTSFATNKYAQIRKYRNINEVLENHLLIQMNSLASVSEDLEGGLQQKSIIKLTTDTTNEEQSLLPNYTKVSVMARAKENCFLIKKDVKDDGCFNLISIQQNLSMVESGTLGKKTETIEGKKYTRIVRGNIKYYNPSTFLASGKMLEEDTRTSEENVYQLESETTGGPIKTERLIKSSKLIKHDIPSRRIITQPLVQQIPGQTNEPVFITQMNFGEQIPESTFITQMNYADLKRKLFPLI